MFSRFMLVSTKKIKTKDSLACLESSWISAINLFAKIVDGQKPLTVFAKKVIVDVLLGSKSAIETVIKQLWEPCLLHIGQYATAETDLELL